MYILIYETKIDNFKCMTDTSVYDCYVKFSNIIVNKHLRMLTIPYRRKLSEYSWPRFVLIVDIVH